MMLSSIEQDFILLRQAEYKIKAGVSLDCPSQYRMLQPWRNAPWLKGWSVYRGPFPWSTLKSSLSPSHHRPFSQLLSLQAAAFHSFSQQQKLHAHGLEDGQVSSNKTTREIFRALPLWQSLMVSCLPSDTSPETLLSTWPLITMF